MLEREEVFDGLASVRFEGALSTWRDRLNVAWLAVAHGRVVMDVTADKFTIRTERIVPEEPQP